MEIFKYASHSCVKCKVLDRVLQQTKLPCAVQVLYVEDEGEDKFAKDGINVLPTLKIVEEGKEPIFLAGTIIPKQIEEAIAKLNG